MESAVLLLELRNSLDIIWAALRADFIDIMMQLEGRSGKPIFRLTSVVLFDSLASQQRRERMAQPLFSVEKVIGEAVVPMTVSLNPEWGQHFSHDNALQFRLAPSMNAYLFLHEHLQSKDPQQVTELLEKDAIVAYILNCEGQEWVIKTESTTEGKFGLIVYTAKGKPYLSGEGQVESSGIWNARFATLYPGIRNTKRCHLQGGIRGGTGQKTEVQVGGTCEF